MVKERYKVSKWIFLAFAILANGFIIFYSFLDARTTDKWTSNVTNWFSQIVNSFTNHEVEVIPLTSLEASISEDQYNYIPGYELNEIPLGSAKQIATSFAPDTATDKSVTYYTDDNDIVTLNQNGSTLSVVGMKSGNATIYAKNNQSGLISNVEVKVVETVGPQQFTVSIDSDQIAIGETRTLNIDIDGGVLGHNELINFRYYDTRKLIYTSSNTNVLEIDNNGVIYPKSIGLATITVSNSIGVSRQMQITVQNGNTPTMYTDLCINGSNVCYANDMILDQNSNKNHYQLEIYDGDKILDPNDFVWSSSNELLAKVDRHGVLRGFRKASLDDENVIITATSKLTGQTVNYEVTVKNQLPTSMYFHLEIGEKQVWNPTEYTISVGDNIKVEVGYSPNTTVKDVIVTSSNEDLISCTVQGSSFVMHVKNDGTCTIKISSVINPELETETNYTILKAGAIKTEEVSDVGHSLRKSVGHATVFGIAQIFTLITFYMFLFDKKWWFYSSISLGEGLLLAIISEIIQSFVPGRTGAFLDVLIDFSGVLVGFIIISLLILLIINVKKKKQKH